MKTLIRNGVFETNSSSAHSLSINCGDKVELYDNLTPDEDGVLRIYCGGYNFSRQYPRRTNDTEEKIAFFATLFTRWEDNPEESSELEELKDILLEYTGAHEVRFFNLGSSSIEFGSDFDIPTGTCLKRAILDKNSWLFIQGDEYSLDKGEDEEEFYNPKEITE